MTRSSNVYVNDSVIGTTEVYHARKGHATQRRRWKDERVRQTTAEEAREDGLRPCKQCFPTDAAQSCPACGFEGDGDDVLAADQQWCANEDCRVVSFHEEVKE